MQNTKDRRQAAAPINSDRRSGADRRQYPRIAVEWPVDYDSKDTYLFSYISDISAMGIFVHTSIPEAPGTILHLTFTPPGQKTLSLEGKVTWINPVNEDNHPERRPGMGIQFINVSDAQKQQLQDLIQTIALLDHDLIESSQQPPRPEVYANGPSNDPAY